MDVSCSLGTSTSYRLARVVLVHECSGVPRMAGQFGAGDDTGGPMVTVHGILPGPDDGAPLLGPEELGTVAFLKNLLAQLQPAAPAEFLPPNVLARSRDFVCWYTPPQVRTMFYQSTTNADAAALTGKRFPVPALLWRLDGNRMHVRALLTPPPKGRRGHTPGCTRQPFPRPGAADPVAVAPFWNTAEDGHVCQGSMRRPTSISVETLAAWEEGFWRAAFTHAWAVSAHFAGKRSFTGTWAALAGEARFPVALLRPVAGMTVADFIAGRFLPATARQTRQRGQTRPARARRVRAQATLAGAAG